jgi:hypothetical protein
MKTQTISISSTPSVLVRSITGDLRVAGWDRSELMVKTDGDMLELEPDSDPLVIACDEDLIIYLPRAANLNVEDVAGDASLQALNGPVTLGPVAGDLTIKDLGPLMLDTVAGDASLHNIGAVTAKSISGDFSLRGGNGPCAIETVGGDASIRDVNGPLAIDSVGSDLYVRNVNGPVNVSVGADAVLYLEPISGPAYDVTAGDDLIVRLPAEVKVKLHLTGGSSESVHVDFPGVELPEECASCEVTIGEVAEGMPEMILTAGDDLLVTSQAEKWEFASGFDSGEWGIPPIPPIPPISPLPPDFSERINRRVQAAMERSQIHAESVGRRVEAAGRKMEASMRRAEAKARAAEVRARRGQVDINIGRWNWDLTPRGPIQTNEPISNDERLTILRMLQEKKITLADAEKLLAALEGKQHFFPLTPTLPLRGRGKGRGQEENLMTDQERNQVLKMIEEGKISPEEGLKLIQALEQNLPDEEAAARESEAGQKPAEEAQTERSGLDVDPRIDRVKSVARRLWQIPLWIGIGIIIMSALGMYAIMQGPGMNFWFYCLTMPLLLGVVVITAAVGSRQARWLFVDVQQKPGEQPRRIFLGFPLPLKLAAWALRTFGHYIPELKKTNVDEVIQVVEAGFTGDAPLIVNVDEGDDGERVKVYIG